MPVQESTDSQTTSLHLSSAVYTVCWERRFAHLRCSNQFATSALLSKHIRRTSTRNVIRHSTIGCQGTRHFVLLGHNQRGGVGWGGGGVWAGGGGLTNNAGRHETCLRSSSFARSLKRIVKTSS